MASSYCHDDQSLWLVILMSSKQMLLSTLNHCSKRQIVSQKPFIAHFRKQESPKEVKRKHAMFLEHCNCFIFTWFAAFRHIKCLVLYHSHFLFFFTYHCLFPLFLSHMIMQIWLLFETAYMVLHTLQDRQHLAIWLILPKECSFDICKTDSNLKLSEKLRIRNLYQ